MATVLDEATKIINDAWDGDSDNVMVFELAQPTCSCLEAPACQDHDVHLAQVWRCPDGEAFIVCGSIYWSDLFSPGWSEWQDPKYYDSLVDAQAGLFDCMAGWVASYEP